jgi:hypothetical protein
MISKKGKERENVMERRQRYERKAEQLYKKSGDMTENLLYEVSVASDSQVYVPLHQKLTLAS